MEAVSSRLAEVRRRIEAAGGDVEIVKIIAVTKGFGPEAVFAAEEAGLADLGENYAQELVAKAAAAEKVRWHFVGRLQRNKVRELAPIVHLWQSVDREALGHEIAKRSPGARVLVQVNVSDEPQKGGCSWAEAPGLVERLRAGGLTVEGLMAVGPAGPPEAARPGFRRLARLAGELDLAELSIGMTGDLEVAVQEGATMVRVGTALFGPRPGPGDTAG
jgi:pyridoxal phosphate enzyme (YggS family)